jgi:hypothetical protein
MNIRSLNDLHAVLTHIFEATNEKYVKTEAKNFFPDFKLLRRDSSSIKVAVQSELSFNQDIVDYSFIKNNKSSENTIAICECNNEEEYEFRNDDVVNIRGMMSYSRHHTIPVKKNGKTIKNERVVLFAQFGDTFVCEKQINEYFEKYGLEIVFNKKASFFPVKYNFNCDVDSKKRFKDVFRFDAIAKIKDASKANKLCYSSVGRAKSYGFGSVWISKISDD